MSEQLATLPASTEVAQAILATTRAVGTLGKAAVNPHGGYKYVSIDKFYETVARIATDNGLNWTLREIAFHVMPDVGKTGAVRITYEVDLMHISGCKIPIFSALTIIHPIQGAQTVGSAMSYADKIFMRQTFKVSTGEKDIDADETDNSALDIRKADFERAQQEAAAFERRRAMKVELPGEDGDWDALEASLKLAADVATNSAELLNGWSDNILGLEKLKDGHPEAHGRVLAHFTARKAELKKGK